MCLESRHGVPSAYVVYFTTKNKWHGVCRVGPDKHDLAFQLLDAVQACPDATSISELKQRCKLTRSELAASAIGLVASARTLRLSLVLCVVCAAGPVTRPQAIAASITDPVSCFPVGRAPLCAPHCARGVSTHT